MQSPVTNRFSNTDQPRIVSIKEVKRPGLIYKKLFYVFLILWVIVISGLPGRILTTLFVSGTVAPMQMTAWITALVLAGWLLSFFVIVLGVLYVKGSGSRGLLPRGITAAVIIVMIVQLMTTVWSHGAYERERTSDIERCQRISHGADEMQRCAQNSR